MNRDSKPLVSILVPAYNSSKTVVETLDSIYDQTYPKLELIVSDDCSTDSTVQVCREWMEEHKDRFVRTELLTVERNTGISANLNRAERACQGEWVKGIAGDDLLLPNCISDYVDYVTKHPDAVCVFGKMQFLGAPAGDCSLYEEVFDYSFFSLSPQEQLHKLVFERNYVPAATCFYGVRRMKELGMNGWDERIPMLEDWPKWISLLRNGVRLDFVDHEMVVYRVGSGLSTSSRMSVDYFKSNFLFDYYYRFPEWMKEEGGASVVNRMADCYGEHYRMRIEAEDEVERLRHTRAYRLGKFLLRPFSWIKNKLCF